LLSCKKRADKKGDGTQIHLCAVTAQVMATFQLIRFNRVLQIHATREEGLNVLKGETRTDAGRDG